MRIREYVTSDLEALRQMHAAQGFRYPLPDLDSPMFVTKLVLEDDDCDSQARNEDAEARPANRQGRPASRTGREVRDDSSPPETSQGGKSPRVIMAAFLRLTAETYLLHDPAAGTPRRRWQHFLALHEAARRAAAARGLDDVQAFLPPRIARAFGRRLAQLGWTRDPWPCYSRQIFQ